MFAKYLIASLSLDVVITLGMFGKIVSKKLTNCSHRFLLPPTTFLSEFLKSSTAFLAVRNSGL